MSLSAGRSGRRIVFISIITFCERLGQDLEDADGDLSLPRSLFVPATQHESMPAIRRGDMSKWPDAHSVAIDPQSPAIASKPPGR